MIRSAGDATRDAWAGDRAATAARELRFSFPSLRRSHTYVATAVVTLGLAIGSVTALFTIVKRSLLRPLPGVADPSRLVSLEPMRGSTLLYDFSYPDFRDFQESSTTLSGLAAFDGTHMVYRDSLDGGHAWFSYVSGAFFSVLDVRPALGRLLTPADANPGASSPVVVIRYDFWQQHFGGSAAAIGATIRLDGYPLSVIGVAPRGFVGAMALHAMEFWIPLTTMGAIMHDASSSLDSRRNPVGRLVGRLAPGKTVDDAQRELSLIAARLAAAYPDDKDKTVRVYGGAGMTIEERADARRMQRRLVDEAQLDSLASHTSIPVHITALDSTEAHHHRSWQKQLGGIVAGAFMGGLVGMSIEDSRTAPRCTDCAIASNVKNAAVTRGIVIGGPIGGVVGWFLVGHL